MMRTGDRADVAGALARIAQGVPPQLVGMIATQLQAIAANTPMAPGSE